jgi:hypothetical protein
LEGFWVEGEEFFELDVFDAQRFDQEGEDAARMFVSFVLFDCELGGLTQRPTLLCSSLLTSSLLSCNDKVEIRNKMSIYHKANRSRNNLEFDTLP